LQKLGEPGAHVCRIEATCHAAGREM
jgi:hypothetical protein